LDKDISIAGRVDGTGRERIIAEGRYLTDTRGEWAEVNFQEDEKKWSIRFI
jgi:hypothetical protein